ncbi:MAG: diguanylate cyclase [Acidimicrobiales bacterium]
MNNTISKKFVGRLAGYLYMYSTLMIVVLLASPIEFTFSEPSMIPILGSTLLAGLFGLFAPWDRWHSSASLGLAVYALILMAISPSLTRVNPETGFAFYVLVFVWTGLSHPKYTSLVFGPLTAAAMAAAVVFYGKGFDANQVMIGLTTLAVGVVVGEALAIIMQTLRQSEELEHRRIETVGMIVDAAEDLASQVSLEGVGSNLAWYAGELVHGLGSRVILVDVEYEEEAHYNWGMINDASEAGWQIPVEIWTQLSDDGVAISDPSDVPWWAGIDGVNSVLWVSLQGSGQLFGAVAIALTEQPKHVAFLQATSHGVATQGGLAFERVRAKLTLLDQSLRDELTGVGNRRHAMALLGRVGPNDGVVVLDLDHFKEVNDSFGHDRGDGLLEQLAGYLIEALRDVDAVARYGGDEFLLVMWGVGDKAHEVTQRLVEGWRELNPMATLSIGVAVHEPGVTAHASFLRADAALYEAKSRGRDQGVVLMPGEELPTLGVGQRRVSELESLNQLGS